APVVRTTATFSMCPICIDRLAQLHSCVLFPHRRCHESLWRRKRARLLPEHITRISESIVGSRTAVGCYAVSRAWDLLLRIILRTLFALALPLEGVSRMGLRTRVRFSSLRVVVVHLVHGRSGIFRIRCNLNTFSGHAASFLVNECLLWNRVTVFLP
ncbi:unnamed protein product, partial [Ectocarpus fasciculatus]